MVVFNIWAIVVAIPIAIVWFLMQWLFPGLTDGPYGDFAFFTVAMIISAICEIAGAKGRLFFIPMWLLGLIGMGWQAYTFWGWGGIGAVAGVGIGLFAALMLIGRRIEKKEWERAPYALAEAFKLKDNPDQKQFWETMEEALFVPGMMSYNQEVCTHNLAVAKLMREKVVEAKSRGAIDRYVAVIEPGAMPGSEEKPDVDGDLEEGMKEVIERYKEGKVPEEENHTAPA